MRRVLITGGGGFIGYHLARYHVDLGDTVTIFDNLFKTLGTADPALSDLLAHPNVRCEVVDLTRPLPDISGLRELDIVYHLAAINGTRLFYEIPYQVASSNLQMTLNFLEWLRGRTVRRLLYASSSEVYASCHGLGLLKIPTAEDVPVVFTQPTDVRFSYGTSKFMGEFLCLQFGRESSIPATVVRYHNVYGPRMGSYHVIPEFIQRLRCRETPFRILGARETRAFCFVRDAVEATSSVAGAEGAAWEIIHIGDSRQEITIRDLAALMMEEFGERFAIEELEGRAGSVPRRCPDTSKLKRLTGFEARTLLQDGLRQTMSWYLADASVRK
jgi:UDP-glucose 4-epimerase/UDP-glucuronate decarboxylase